jgi:hypothetical protein
LLTHPELPDHQVHIPAAQAQQLASPHPGGKGEVVQRSLAVSSHVRPESLDLLD